MKIAIPVAQEKLCMHFGHCEKFSVFDIDVDNKKINSREDLDAPPHQPGLLPVWLAERGVTNVIAGGMGQRAQAIFTSNNIQVTVGAQGENPEDIINSYLSGSLSVGSNICDH